MASPVLPRAFLLLSLLLLPLLLAGCDPGGEQGSLSTPDASDAPAEQQVIQSLLGLYRQAVLEEDIDRLQALLQPSSALTTAAVRRTQRQAADGTFADLAAFRQALSDTFRTHAITALDIPAAEVVIAPNRRRVTFLEVESTLEPATLAQHTRLFRTTWQLQRTVTDERITFSIRAVQRDGPLVQISTPGQVQAGALTRLTVTTPIAGFGLASVELVSTNGQAGTPLPATTRGFHGTFQAASRVPPAPLQVRLHTTDGKTEVIAHAYRQRLADAVVVQPVAGTETARILAVAVAPDATVWAGGAQGGQLFQVPPRPPPPRWWGSCWQTRTGVSRISPWMDWAGCRPSSLVPSTVA